MSWSSADELRREAERLRREAEHLSWSFVLVCEHTRPASFVGGPLADQLVTLLADADRDLRVALDGLRRAADACDRRAATIEATEPGR